VNAGFRIMMCRFLAAAMLLLPFQSGQAAMVGTDQMAVATSAAADRDTVMNHLARSQTAEQFRNLGLDAQAARDRVATLTDAEVGALAGQLNALPAGGDGGTLLVVALIVFAFWYVAYRR